MLLYFERTRRRRRCQSIEQSNEDRYSLLSTGVDENVDSFRFLRVFVVVLLVALLVPQSEAFTSSRHKNNYNNKHERIISGWLNQNDPSGPTHRKWAKVPRKSSEETPVTASEPVLGSTRTAANRRSQQKPSNRPFSSSSSALSPNQTNRNRGRQRSSSSSFSSSPSRQYNQQIISCPDAFAVLHLLQSTKGALTQRAGGGALNSVNFSTALHRLARFGAYDNPQNQQKYSANGGAGAAGNDSSGSAAIVRARILSDPRFALLLAVFAEALVDPPTDVLPEFSFRFREFSNAAWALAKLRLAPPATVLSLLEPAQAPEPVSSQVDENEKYNNHRKNHPANVKLDPTALVETARELRQQVAHSLKIARQQNEQGGAGQQLTSQLPPHVTWIPLLSKLTGYILDYIGQHVVRQVQEAGQLEPTAATTSSDVNGDTNRPERRNSPRQVIQLQEQANLRW